MDREQTARLIAHAIFKVGEDQGQKVHRIQFMAGNLQNERPMGGLGEGPLAAVIARVLHTLDGGKR